MLKFTEFTDGVIDSADFLQVLVAFSSMLGFTSVPCEAQEALDMFRTSISDPDKVFFYITVDGVAAGICGIHYTDNYYYSLKRNKVLHRENIVKFCSLLLLPAFRGKGLAKHIMHHRLSDVMNANRYATHVIGEIRAEFNEQGMPVTLARNETCWPCKPSPVFDCSTGPEYLVCTDFNVHPDARANEYLFRKVGFSLYGIDPYDNGIQLQLNVRDIPRALQLST